MFKNVELSIAIKSKVGRDFFGFAVISGLGWVCDFGTFTLLTIMFNLSGFASNFVASYVGVTFVWFAALSTVFSGSGGARSSFLFIYWGFQLVSILTYSQFLHLVNCGINTLSWATQFGELSAPAAKIIITPFNLVTNFIFMKFLTRYMHQAKSAHV